MSGEDAVLVLQRHATSKLQNTEDLYSIRTLGFRGEALPSIAAVSRFELTTREASSDIGTRVLVEGGIVTDVCEVGSVPGTEIAVHNLFYNTPARFKFLKSDQAEASRTSEMIGHLALAYPDVSFRLRHNGNESVRAEAGGNPMNAVVSVLGREIARQMLPIAEGPGTAENEVRIGGFVGRPQLTRANRNLQLFFVNGRLIQNRSLQHAVQQAYEGLLHGHGRFPVAVIFLHVPPNSVDVNVHPTKSEVRFAREWELHHAVRVAVRETLAASQLAPGWGFSEAERAPNSELTAPFGHPLNAPTNSGAPDAASPVAASTQYSQHTGTPPDYRGFYQPVAPRGGDMTQFRQAQHDLQAANNAQGANAQGAFPDFAPPPEEEQRVSLKPLAQISNNAYILCEGGRRSVHRVPAPRARTHSGR
jgi:DNA mismatch repair protein MutL